MYHPEEEEYKIYYAQALYQACLYEEAMKVTVQIENPEMNGKVNYYIKLISLLVRGQIMIMKSIIQNSTRKLKNVFGAIKVRLCIYAICKSRKT